MIRTWAAALMCVAALSAVGCGADSERALDIEALEGNPDAGAGLYTANCASCHGVDATGSDLGPNLLRELHHDDAALADVILSGKDSMPAFEEDLDDQEIADILAWLRTL